MNTPTHQEVENRAKQLWEDYGRPSGRDTEIWYEAERQLSRGSPDSQTGTIVAPTKQLEEPHNNRAEREKAAQQKRDARAPIEPKKVSPPMPTPETGKPLYPKPHSS